MLSCFELTCLGWLPVLPSHWGSHVTGLDKIRGYQIWWCQRLCDWTFPPCPPPRKPDIECSMNNVVVRWCCIMLNNFLFTFFPLQKSELLHYVKINVSSDSGPSKHLTTVLWSRQHWTTDFGTETHTLQLAQNPWVNLHSGSLQFAVKEIQPSKSPDDFLDISC